MLMYANDYVDNVSKAKMPRIRLEHIPPSKIRRSVTPKNFELENHKCFEAIGSADVSHISIVAFKIIHTPLCYFWMVCDG